MKLILRHPFWRYGAVLTCALAAAATVAISAYVNLLSAPWAAGLYLTVFLAFKVVRSGVQMPLMKSYLLYLVTMGGYFLIVYFSYAAVPGPNLAETRAYITRWTWIGMMQIANLLPAARFTFTLRFTRLHSPFWRALEAAAWLACGFFTLASLTPWFIKEFLWVGFVWVPSPEGLYGWFFFVVTACFTANLFASMWALFTTKDSRHRLQMLYFVIGDIPMWMTCWTHFFISMGINIIPLGGLMVLWHAAVMGYAVLYKRVFDFSIVIRRGLAYAFASVLLGLCYGLVVWLLVEEFNVNLASGLVPAVIFLTVIGLLFAPLLDAMQRVVDRLFFREDIDRQALLSNFAREMASTIDLEIVIRTTCTLLKQSLQPRAVRLYLLNEQGQPFLCATLAEDFDLQSATPGDTIRDPVFARLQPGGKVERIRLSEQSLEGRPIQIADGDEHLLIPILHRDSRLGVILLEPPRGREQYDFEDEQFAGTVAAQATIALLHARSYASMARLQELTQRTLEGVPFGVLAVTAHGNVSICNQAFRRMLNFDSDVASLMQVWHAHPDLADIVKPAIARSEPLENIEMRFNGGALQCLLSLKILAEANQLHGGGPLYLLLLHDVTEYKRMELLARRREGLAQVGEMIASINHEISNILQPVRFQVQRLQESTEPKPSFRRAMEVIPDRLSALDRLLGNLRDLARPVEIRVRSIDLPDLLDSLARELRDHAGRDVSITVDCAPDALVCHADGHWLRQVLYNLGKNALEACEQVQHPDLRFRTSLDGAWLTLQLQDNGCGIAPEQLARLFEPFFTTKGHGAGTGLGLSLSRKLILLHGGRIDVASVLGKGTTFTITLPAGLRVPETASST